MGQLSQTVRVTNIGREAHSRIPLRGALLLSFGLPVFLAIGSVLPLPAQGPVDLIPSDALIGIGWSGADSLEAAALQTSLGQIIAEPRVQEMLDALIPSIEMVVQKKLHDPEQREGILFLREVLAEIWSHPLAISLTGIGFADGKPIPEGAICLRAGDGAMKIFQTIENIREREGAPAESYPDAASARRIALPGAPVPLIYGVERGCFFLALSEPAARATLGRIRGEGSSIESSPSFRNAWNAAVGDSESAKWIYIDGASLRTRALQLLSDADAMIPPPVRAIFADDCLGRLGSVLFSVGIEGQGFRRAAFIGWRGDGPLPAPLDEGTLELVPRDTSFFSYEDNDLAGLFTKIRTFVESTDADAGRQVRSFKAIADGFLGFRIEEDFLASLGRRFLVFEEPTATGLIPGLCIVLRPNDGQKVQNCVRRLTTSLGAFAGIKGVGVSVQERGGVSFIETSGAPVPIAPAWATRGDRLFLALHPTVLEEVLHRIDAPNARANSILANDDFKAARKRISADQHGIFYTDTKEVVSDLYPIALPLFQAGIAALGGQVPGLSAAQLPPPYVVNERMFGDIHGYRSTDDGWVWEAHGPLPFTLPNLGSLVPLALLGGVAPMVAARQRMEHVVLAEEMVHDSAVRSEEPVPAPEPVDSYLNLDVHGVFAACRQYASDHSGDFPSSLDSLVKDGALAASSIRRGDQVFFKYAGSFPVSGESDRVLFHTTEPVAGDQYLLVTVTGEEAIVSHAELERRVKASNWPKKERL